MVFQSSSKSAFLYFWKTVGYWRLMKEWTAKDHCRDFIVSAPFFVEEKNCGKDFVWRQKKKTATQETKKNASLCCEAKLPENLQPLFLVSHSTFLFYAHIFFFFTQIAHIYIWADVARWRGYGVASIFLSTYFPNSHAASGNLTHGRVAPTSGTFWRTLYWLSYKAAATKLIDG